MADTILTGWDAIVDLKKVLKASSSGADQSTHTLNVGDEVFCDQFENNRYRVFAVNGKQTGWTDEGWAPADFLKNIHDGTFTIPDPGGNGGGGGTDPDTITYTPGDMQFSIPSVADPSIRIIYQNNETVTITRSVG